jgi:hypothetical protein
MRLNIKGLALAAGILWGAAILGVGLANLIWAPYGTTFLQVMSSIRAIRVIGTCGRF